MRKAAPPSRQALLSALAGYGRQFYERRWMWGTSGNLSVKLRQSPLEIAITPSGCNKGALTPSDLIVLKGASTDKRGAAAGPSSRTPSAETIIHQTIYQTLPGCGAVFHIHPLYPTIISGLYGHPSQPQRLHIDWFEMMKGVGIGDEESAEVPILPNWQDVSLIAHDIRQYLLGTPKVLPVALIYNHGLTGWGRTPEEARNYLEIMDYVCEYLYLKRLIK